MKLLKPLGKSTKPGAMKRKRIRRKSLLGRLGNRKKLGKNKKKRDEKIKRRKNFLPSLIVTILFWLATAYMIFFTNPLSHGSVQLFFLSLCLSLFFTTSIIFANTRRAVLFTFSITLFLLLRYFGIGNIINVLLIAGLAITVEIYFSKN